MYPDLTVPFPRLYSLGKFLAMALMMLGGCILLLCLPAYAQADMRIVSDTQTFQPMDGSTELDGRVLIAMEDTQITAPHANIKMGEDGKPSSAVFTNRSKMVRKTGGSKQTIQADTMDMGLKSGSLEAKGSVVTNISGDSAAGNVSIHSDTQVFDQERHIMRAIGNVSVKSSEMNASSPEAIIFLGKSGGADKVIFTKGAKLIQGDQEMTAESITIRIDSGNIYAENNVKSTLMGKNEQGQPTRVNIQSHLQELDKATGTLLANGNTQVLYEDFTAKGPKAVFYRENDQLDRIVLTGRAQIEDAERKVVGDIVTITMNPKQFNAQGNVTTFIKARRQQTASATTPATASGSVKPASGGATAAPQHTETIDSSPWEQEEIIEKATQGSDKTP